MQSRSPHWTHKGHIVYEQPNPRWDALIPVASMPLYACNPRVESPPLGCGLKSNHPRA